MERCIDIYLEGAMAPFFFHVQLDNKQTTI